MGIKVNADVWGSIFAVPSCVVDEHIRLAGGQQLKVLLFVLRHNNENIDENTVAVGTGMSVGDVKDALGYWIENGLISIDGKSVAKSSMVQAANNPMHDLQDIPDITPTYEQVAARLLEDGNLKALFNEVQMKLGRTIGYSDQAKLLMMHDDYGLPVEVILTIVEYCVSVGKLSVSYICRVAKDWAESGVLTLEAADAKIKEIQSDERLWKKFANMFSVNPPLYNTKRFSFLKKWNKADKHSLELIFFAYEEMVEHMKDGKISFAYMDKILESWKSEGLKKPQDVIRAKAAKKDNLKSSEARQVGGTSYDTGKVKQKAQSPIEYKRRNKDGE